MTDLKARVDKLRTSLLCGSQRCHQKLATLNADEQTPFSTMKRAAILFSKEWKQDEHDVWCYHAIPDRQHKDSASSLVHRGRQGLSSTPITSRGVGFPTGLIPEIARLRRAPPLPATVRCPRCSGCTVVDEAFLNDVFTASIRAAATANEWRARHIPRQLGNFTNSPFPEEANAQGEE